ncbi:virulence factor family protein [Candidatus Binatus sp.]|uniref:virulence factor family protein n=1 Tax=Candidatus Binatus sp. TaxID=2811406 RepID=UPI003BAE4AEC
MICLRCTLAFIAAALCLCASSAHAFEPGRFGSVKLAEPAGQARAVVIYFSGRKGLSKGDETAAQAMAKDGVLVAEIDSRKYLSRLDKLNEKCHWLVYDTELLTRQLERERRLPTYLTPIVAGVGEGGTLAELNLVQAPAVTIAGAVSLDPAETIASRQPICSELPTTARRGGFSYRAPKKLPGFWIVGLTPKVHKTDREYIMKLRHEGAPIDLHEMPPTMAMGDALRSLIEPYLAKPRPAVTKIPTNTAPSVDISALPLAELPVDHPSKLMAILLSGDGGWRDLDKTIAEDLQQQGIPVVGLDTLRYFWSKKTPEQTADVVAALIQTFMTKWHADKVALIGYSFGADVIPFAYNRLPTSLRDHVVLIALLGLSKSADFEISVRGWLGEPPGPDALPVLPQATKIPPQLIQCFYGHDETDTACPTLAQRGSETFRRNGAHHYDGDYGTLANLISTGFKQRAGLSLNHKPDSATN